MKIKTEETIKLIKYVTGSVAAVLLAAALQLQFAYAAGIITLLTIQDTKKETVRITAKRMIIFVIMTIYIELEDKTDYTGSCRTACSSHAASVCVCRRNYHSPDDPGYEERNCADNSEAHDHICDHDDLVSSDLSTCRISRVGVRYCTDPISV